MYVLNILNMLYTLRFFFFSKCSLFHNANLFGSSIIHILYTECAEIKKKNNFGSKGLITQNSERNYILVQYFYFSVFKVN